MDSIMHRKDGSSSHFALAAGLVGPLLLLGAALPPKPSGPPVPEDWICPPTVHTTFLPCCADGQGGFATCVVTQSVTATSTTYCAPCSFEYDVTVNCSSCGAIQVSGESGIVCASREGHYIPCPDGVGDAVILQFVCGFCDIPPSGQ
jgi:hypothetical protein